MKKINLPLIFFIFIFQYSFSQQFIEDQTLTLKGIIYGEAVWLNMDNNSKKELLISGYDDDYNHFSGLYSFDYDNEGLLPVSIAAYADTNIEKLDYNHDGFMDFLVIGYNTNDEETVMLYINTGTGDFTELDISIIGTSSGALEVADFNNDDLIDIIITGVTPDYNYSAKLYLQDEAGNFNIFNTALFDNTFGNILAFDANNDGNTDVLLTGFNDNYTPDTKLYFNDGNAVFTENTNSTIENIYFSSTDAADYDNDGDLDLLITGFNTSYIPFTALYDNDSDGNFTLNTQVNLKQLYWGQVNFVDYDNDDDLDLFITGADANTVPQVKFYSNTNNEFNEDTAASNTIDATYISSCDWSDYDNDGDLDLVISGLGSGNSALTKVYTNQQINLSTEDFTQSSEIVISPNPSLNKQVNLAYDITKLSSNKNEIAIYSMTGLKVFKTTLKANSEFYTKTLNLSNLSEGIYILQFTSGDYSTSKKLILK